MFEVQGGRITLFDGWSPGGTADAGRTWAPEELGPVIADLLANATAAAPVYGAS
jgi:hypothetical protein